MDELMLRRRGMMGAEAEPETWDYEWLPVDGSLADNGFTLTKVGTSGYATVALYDDYFRFRGTSSSYYNADYADAYATGVLEIEVSFPANNGRFMVYLSNGVDALAIRMQYSTNYKGIYLGTTNWNTQLATISLNTVYKIRLVSKGTVDGVAYGDVYFNGALVAGDVAFTNSDFSVSCLSGRSSGSSGIYSYLHSVKMKFNRTT